MSRRLSFVVLAGVLVVGAVAPLFEKSTSVGFYLEVLLGGLMTGVLYSLVALGFVLIYKASGVFNFAQGAMVLFAALALARLSAAGLSGPHYLVCAALLGAVLAMFAMRSVRRERAVGSASVGARVWGWGVPSIAGVAGAALAWAAFGDRGWPLWLALPAAVAIMVALAAAIERVVLRPLVNQEGVVLLMATLGITYFLEGFGQSVWGNDIYEVALGFDKAPMLWLASVFDGGILVNREDVFAAVIATVLVATLAIFFQRTPVGRALRAVADDHQAAQSIGIPLNRIWVIVWSVAGVVALVAGMVWGSKLGVQFSLALIALKALPVVILGGLTSVPGAIVGGLIVGVGEKMAEVFAGPTFGGGIETWFAYALALVFLLIRPEGLFGEKIIDRV